MDMTFEQFAVEIIKRGWWIQMMAQATPPGQRGTPREGWFISVRERGTNRTEFAETIDLQETMKSVLFNMAQKRPTFDEMHLKAGYGGNSPGSDEDKKMLAAARKGIHPLMQAKLAHALGAMTIALRSRTFSVADERHRETQPAIPRRTPPPKPKGADIARTGSDDREDDLSRGQGERMEGPQGHVPRHSWVP